MEEDLLTSIPPPFQPTQTHASLCLMLPTHGSFQLPLTTTTTITAPPPSFFLKVPVLANLSIRCCPVVAVMAVCDGGPYTSSGSQLGAARWLTRQVVSQSADSRNTLTADLEDNGPCSLYLTCHGSRSPINFGHIRKDGGKHVYCTALRV